MAYPRALAAFLLLCTASAFAPRRMTVTAKVFHNYGSGLNLQSRSGGVERAARMRSSPLVLQASGDDDGAKIDLSSVDWDKANKTDLWATWKVRAGGRCVLLVLPSEDHPLRARCSARRTPFTGVRSPLPSSCLCFSWWSSRNDAPWGWICIKTRLGHAHSKTKYQLGGTRYTECDKPSSPVTGT